MSRDQARQAEIERQVDEFLGSWSRRDFLKRTTGGAALAAFMFGGMDFLAACANAGTSTNTSSVTPKKGGHVVYATISDVQTFNPVLSADTASSYAISLMYDGLYTTDSKGQLYPLLAKGLPQTSSDGLTYTIPLRQDVKWTDGSSLTSDDVLFTYQLMWDPKYKPVNSPRRASLEKYVESITAPDKYTIVFKTKSLYAPFGVNQLLFGILPKAQWGSLAPAEINTTDLNSSPKVTSGTFKFVSWQKGQQITFARNDSYYRGAPYLDTFIYKVITSTQALDQLKTGEIDISGIDLSQADAAKAVDSIALLNYPQLSFEFYAYQLDPTKTKLFQEKEVRQALFYALNRQALADAIYFKYATVANTSMPPASWAYNANNKPVYNFDVSKANSLLDAAGWAKGSDGIRAKAGSKLAFTVITNAGNKVRENLITNFQQQWKDIGVDATPKFVDFNKVLVPAITTTRLFELFMVGFSWGVDPDQSDLWSSDNTIQGGFNGMDYKNPTLDKVMTDANSTLDINKRKQFFFQMQQILAEDMPAGILLFPQAVVGITKRVQNYKPGTFVGNRTFYKDVFVTDGK